MPSKRFRQELNTFWSLIDENMYGITLRKKEVFSEAFDEQMDTQSQSTENQEPPNEPPNDIFAQLITITTREKIYNDFCMCIQRLKQGKTCTKILDRLENRISIHTRQLKKLGSPDYRANKEMLKASHGYLSLMHRRLVKGSA
jgi:hypothetical protein